MAIFNTILLLLLTSLPLYSNADGLVDLNRPAPYTGVQTLRSVVGITDKGTVLAYGYEIGDKLDLCNRTAKGQICKKLKVVGNISYTPGPNPKLVLNEEDYINLSKVGSIGDHLLLETTKIKPTNK